MKKDINTYDYPFNSKKIKTKIRKIQLNFTIKVEFIIFLFACLSSF